MGRFLVVTRPNLVAGFRLAGVEAVGAADARAAEALLQGWLERGETGLLAIDEGLLGSLAAPFLRRLEAGEHLSYISIPGSEPLGSAQSRRDRITELIRRAIGFHITFKGEPHKS